MALQRFDEHDGCGDRRPQTVIAKGSDERERPCRAFGEAADASAVDDQHGSAGLVELTIADASHDRVGARLLTRSRFADFSSQLGEVVVGRFKDVTAFGTPGQPLTAKSLGQRLLRLDINCSTRVAALHHLISHIPASVLADLIGYNPNVIAEQAVALATPWAHYAAIRATT